MFEDEVGDVVEYVGEVELCYYVIDVVDGFVDVFEKENCVVLVG